MAAAGPTQEIRWLRLDADPRRRVARVSLAVVLVALIGMIVIATMAIPAPRHR